MDTETPTSPPPPPPPPQQSKSKRSGKSREEAKARAIAAAAEAAAASAVVEEHEETGQQGVKRKREDGDDELEEGGGEQEEEEEKDTTPQPDLEIVRKRIPQALKSLLPILKKARSGETQRVIKKVKFLRSKQGGDGGGGDSAGEAELKELETQLEALKKLDLHTLLAPLLLMKLRKHPFIRTLLPLPTDLLLASTPSTAPETSTSATSERPAGTATETDLFASSTPEGKVRNRLVSAKGVGEQVNGVVGWCVGVEGGKLKAGVKRAKPTPQEDARKGGKHSVPSASKSADGSGKFGRKERMEFVLGEEDDLAAQNAAADAAGWESGSVDDVSGEEDGDLSDDDMDDSDADSDVVRQDDYTSASSGPSAPSGKKSKETKNNGSASLFLPTLASGFTMGDYDSDPDEDDRRDKKSGKGGLIQSVRKNRRGQAERRKIWEKKYGKGANHVKKQEEEGVRVTKDAQMLASQMGGAAAKPKWGQKGAPVKSDGGMRDAGWAARHAQPATGGRVPYVAVAPAAVVKKDVPPKPATTATGTEHPSWAAARARKEKMEMVAAVKPKKIVFD
ncbi:hypothetical protein QFC21_006938 [Naganishia friedmannii]|uniref:Uncharacterized protein n=1 Tax=Naganishia friedmannii TaxID=89922 RepID=A0ACC2V0Q3_9TREE|nr:hypothetical protein QFC21_006938 [Naganishia friedmannii]